MTKFLIFILVLGCGLNLYAEEKFKLQTVKILGTSESYKEPGSIYQVSEEDIESKGGSNPHEILKDVPGVTIQQEDGVGLRPNIGLRGTHPHRSKKITLMEDGVLIGPAPYSAPAAYYFPLMNKVTGVEIYKGPSSIKYGPNSVGGAINFLTRDLSEKNEGEVDLSYGSYETFKGEVWHSAHLGAFSWLVDYNYIESGGFKTLPGGGDTGFSKNDLLLKGRYRFRGKKERVLDFKFGYGNEDSNETYLGLSREDFNQDPYQRYEVSRDDKMSWDHRQYQVKFFNEWTSRFFSDFSLYRNEFQRVWDKVNGFKDNSVDIQDVLAQPSGQNKDFLDVLRGDKDSSVSETLLYGKNDRKYYSQGLGLDNRWYLSGKDHLDFGFLYHVDQIERFHTLQDASVQGGRVLRQAANPDPNNQNRDQTRAFKTYLVNTYENQKWLFRAGARLEHVKSESENRITKDFNKKKENYFVPGLGLTYKVNKSHLMFLGVNKGLTIPGPRQKEQIEPEEAINYEVGYRFKGKLLAADLVAFYSDYQNILGTCSFSSGCTSVDLDSQFNGGEATIWGLEFLSGVRPSYKEWVFPLSLSATYTNASFDSFILSENKEWGVGQIRSGDPLPYISDWVISTRLGVDYQKWSGVLSYTWKSKFYDQSVQEGRRELSGFGILNLHLDHKATEKLVIYADIQNLLGEEYISSLRPFGARPGAPFWLTAGIKYSF